ncbi:MAG: hypothetical protein A2808_00455 [Candidatus Moranbacteria bacterium RIFCSPHIGHO2_01_FULL_55_24]|nr:MAG: hypothetical protein A2808_00455 [Candidatus Moranbacteria bacterium RIFCSPHIGHO2_01_FULL_55_24]
MGKVIPFPMFLTRIGKPGSPEDLGRKIITELTEQDIHNVLKGLTEGLRIRINKHMAEKRYFSALSHLERARSEILLAITELERSS